METSKVEADDDEDETTSYVRFVSVQVLRHKTFNTYHEDIVGTNNIVIDKNATIDNIELHKQSNNDVNFE